MCCEIVISACAARFVFGTRAGIWNKTWDLSQVFQGQDMAAASPAGQEGSNCSNGEKDTE